MLTPLAALAADAMLGEPPSAWHPVVWFGRAARSLERRSYRPSISFGAAHTAVLVGGAWLVGVGARRLMGRAVADVAAGAISIAGAMLASEVAGVAAALESGDLELARFRVSRIVGRETSSLDDSGVARAAVESLAENTVDAVTAPLCWLAIGGAPGVLAHRAINTLDAMIGHRDDRYDRFGRAAARADDVVAWAPARLTALVVGLARPTRYRTVWSTIRRDADVHPSPNGGVVESAFAGALGITLGGVNRYGSVVEDRGTLGDGPPPTADELHEAIALARQVWWITAVLVCTGRLLARIDRSFSPRR